MKPTDEQKAIKDAAARLKAGDVLKVIAFAGAGKTSTLKLCAQARQDRGIYLAFNKEIASEAKAKLATTKCQAATMHSLAFGAMRGIMDKPADVNGRSFMASGIADDIHIPEVRGWGRYRIAQAVVRTMSAFAASDDTEMLPVHGVAALQESLGDPDFMIDTEKAHAVRTQIAAMAGPLSQMAGTYWVQLMNEGQFSHDMYLKMLDLDEDMRQTAFARYKYVMVDEAQDLNPVQRSILLKTGLPMIAVGDPYQQIYSWRGAENALQKMDGKTLHLTQSFRFGEDPVAKLARHILDQIPDGGPAKRLVGAGPGNMADYDGPKGAVICRTNVGMLDSAMHYIRKGWHVHVDNVGGLVTDVRSAQALREGRTADVKTPELKQFDTWDELEMTAEEGGDPGLSKLVRMVREGRIRDVEHLASNHKTNASDAHFVVCTAHRSKGLEFPVVQLSDDWPDVKNLSSRFESAQEKSEKHVTLAREGYNTLYVAATRAMTRVSGYGRILNPQPDPDHDPREADVQPA